MEIRNLRTFLQVASLQNFTRAAESLGYSQSNVSTQIQQLEQEIGAPLFNRIGRRITLTQYGEQLLPYARQIVSTSAWMENFFKSDQALGGTLRIGLVESLFGPLIEPAVPAYHRRFPRVKIELTVDGSEALKTQLAKGILDAACLIDDALPPSAWQVWYQAPTPIVVAANPASPLAGKRSVRLKDLAGEEIILMEETASYSAHFLRAAANAKLAAEPFLTLQSADMARRFVENGNFLAVLPWYAVQESVKKEKICRLPMADFKEQQFIQMILPLNKIRTPQIEGFLREMQQAAEGILHVRTCP